MNTRVLSLGWISTGPTEDGVRASNWPTEEPESSLLERPFDTGMKVIGLTFSPSAGRAKSDTTKDSFGLKGKAIVTLNKCSRVL